MTPEQAKVCKLCGAQSLTLSYEGPIRAGSYGKQSERAFRVLRCAGCTVEFLDPFPEVRYESGDYRTDYNDSTLISDYFAAHDRLQTKYLNFLADRADFRGRVVGDFGCGGGSFLDLVRVQAKQTVAIEPFEGYHSSLRERGHRVYGSGAEYLADGSRAPLDLAVSFHVIEHVTDPVRFLKEMAAALVPGGVAFVLTPNSEDILTSLAGEAYRRFNYRTAHLWYFNQRSLAWLASRCGFASAEFLYQHFYDLSNAFCWARDGQPTGLKHITIFDESLDAAWREFLERTQRSDAVWMKLRK